MRHYHLRSLWSFMPRGLRVLCAAAISAAPLFAASPAAAFQALEIAPVDESDRSGLPESYRGPVSAVAAIVGDEVITTYDVRQRIQLMIISSGGRISPEIASQLQVQALRDLKDEKLKLAEAKTFELVPEKKEIDAEISGIAAQSGLTAEQLAETFALNGLSLDTLRGQIGASIVWPQLVQGRYGKRVRITDEQIDATVERMREEATAEQYLVSEICIPVPSPAEAQTYYQGGLQLIEQMRRGVPFTVVAQQFSACTSAAAGGDLGWIRPGELPTELDTAIQALEVGSVTNPIPSEGAFMILAVRDKREARQQGEKTYTLAYASAPLSMGRTQALQALEKLETAGACGGSNTRRQDLGEGVGVALMERAKLDDINPRFHRAIDGLDQGDLSGAIESEGYMHIAYICELDEGLGIPSRRSIEDRLFGRQLNRISQQYLRDVERKTMVDIRAKPQQPNG